MSVKELQVTALKLGSLGVDKSAMTCMSGPGTSLVLPVWAALVEGAGLKVLVDTDVAFHSLFYAMPHHRRLLGIGEQLAPSVNILLGQQVRVRRKTRTQDHGEEAAR